MTVNEWLFSILLMYLGLPFFAKVMGDIASIFAVHNIDDMIEDKYDALDMWIRKIETSNQGKYIQPKLYADIKMYV